MTSDPEPGSNDFPLPPATNLPGVPAYGPPSYGIPPYGAAPYGAAPYGAPYGGAPYGAAAFGAPAFGPPPAYGQQPGFGPSPYAFPQGQFVQPGMLAAAADRDRTLDVLKAAYTEGRLTKTEFDDRSGRVMTARTYADLHGLITDLPSGAGGQVLPMPYPAGYYPPTLHQRTNGFAVGALICGIVPFFGGIPAVVLGHVARGQIRRTGERGDGVAVAGLVLGYLWLALWALIILVSISHGG